MNNTAVSTMDLFYEKIMRPILFRVPPERAHEYGRNLMQTASSIPFLCSLLEKINLKSYSSVRVMGLEFPNAVGMAAGMDKDADFVRASAAVGFGHIEVGTVTPKPQPGNPQPRLFRYPAEGAIINRMGFNNKGADAMLQRLKKLPPRRKRRYVLGVNIGKNKSTPIESAVEDYLACFSLLAGVADYFTINVSSPNTEGLRSLQGREHLYTILNTLQSENKNRKEGRVPLVLKIAPDLSFKQVDEILNVVTETNIDGLIATNTTIDKTSLSKDPSEYENGGISGMPLQRKATDIIRYICQSMGSSFPVIGVGGIMDAASAGEKIDAGAKLVQVYSGWVYRGPMFARDLARSLHFNHSNWDGS